MKTPVRLLVDIIKNRTTHVALALLKHTARETGKKLLKTIKARRLDQMSGKPTVKNINIGQVVRNFVSQFLDCGLHGGLIPLLIFGSSSRALATNVLDQAFDEQLFNRGESRQAIERSAAFVQAICGKVVSPSNSDFMACRWPGQVRLVLKAYDGLNIKTVANGLRSSRLAAPSRSRHETMKNSHDLASIDLASTLEALELSGALTQMTHALIAQSQSVSWQLAHIELEGGSLEETRSVASLFAAWAQSEEPIGLLLRLNEFDPLSTKETEGVFSCLREEERIAYALAKRHEVHANHRLMFLEVEVSRAAANLPAPGMLNEHQIEPAEFSEAIQSVLKIFKETDLSAIPRAINECRAMAQALEAVGIEQADINRERLFCEQARERGEPLVSNGLPNGTATRQFALILSQVRAERSYRPAASERRAVSLFRSLETAPNSGFCKPDLKSRLADIVSQLEQLIIDKKFQE